MRGAWEEEPPAAAPGLYTRGAEGVRVRVPLVGRPGWREGEEGGSDG
jgi:hypothetical protein